MDDFERGFRRRMNWEAVAAFAVGVVVSYVVVSALTTYPRSGLFGTLIVAAVGGLWYHIRRIV